VIDLQVLCVKSFSRSARHLPGMNKALSEVLSPVAFAEAERIKAVGKTLFAPEKGGSYDVWTQRPLAPALVEYAAADVLHIFAMHTRWSPLMLETVARNIAAARMRSTIERRTPWPRGPRSKWSEIDF
jgi:exonuclease 3'-5' domain-containing protein 1